MLFIDARKLGGLVDRTRRELSEEDILRIANTYHAWRGGPTAGSYEDISGFCKSASLDDIRKQGHVLAPGRYVGAADGAEDDEPPAEKLARLSAQLRALFSENAQLEGAIKNVLTEIDNER